MTDQTTDFFDNLGGSGAPTARLSGVDDYAHGEIVDMFKRDYVPYGKTEPEKNKDGTNRQQLVVILQTAFRNWQNVTKVPVQDYNDPNSPVKDPSEDDGKRAVYVPAGSNIQYAIGRAVSATGKPFEVGATLGVKVFNLKDTGKGNPLKEHEAVYTPKAAGADFFPSSEPAAQAAPATQSTPPVSAEQAAAQGQSTTPPPAAQGNPWETAPSTSKPPF